MEESNLKICGTDEISPVYRGKSVLLVLSVDDGETCRMSRANDQLIGQAVLRGEEGVVFKGVDYQALAREGIIIEDGRCSTSFDYTVERIKRKLAVPERRVVSK